MTRCPLRLAMTATLVAMLGGLAAARQAQPPKSMPTTMEEMHRMHSDSKLYIATLDDPARDEYQKPHEVVTALALKEGDRIADIGAGSGYFTFRFARHVGASGRVFAVDINTDMIAHVNERVRAEKTTNVTAVLAKPDDPLLPAAAIDRVFICDTWHHIQDRGAYAAKLLKALRPGGRVVIVDFQKKALPVGPPDEMKLAREEVIADFEPQGFRLEKEETFLPYQYFLVFAPAAK
jgi:arsenite methyltransferase